MDDCYSCQDDQATMIDNIGHVILQRINPAGTHLAKIQPHNNLGGSEVDFLDYVLEVLLGQPDTSINHLSSFIAATKTCM
jgi:hypothetical protein